MQSSDKRPVTSRKSRRVLSTKSERVLSKAERGLLKTVTQLLSERSRARAKKYADVRAFTSTRRRAGRDLQRSIRRQALSAAGIGEKVILDRQARDRKTVDAFISSQERRARATALEVGRRHAHSATSRVSGITRHFGPSLDPSAPQGNQELVVRLFRVADAVMVSRPLKGGESVSTGDLKNLALIEADTAAGGAYTVDYDWVFLAWHFVWQPPRSGPISIISSFQQNGLVYVRTDPLWLIGGWASVSMFARIGIYQGRVSDLSDAIYTADVHLKDEGLDCYGEVEWHRLDEELALVHNKQLVVSSDEALDATVEVGISSASYYGATGVDFLRRGYNLNVPWLQVMLWA